MRPHKLKHILTVDDEAAVCAVIRTCLTSAGFEVTCASKPSQALELVKQHHFDLATVDVVMPEGDGLGLTRILRDRYGLGVIIVSGLGDPTERVIGLEIGADDYMAKPFSPRELVARVRSVLRRLEDRASVGPAPNGTTYVFEGWRLDVAARELYDPDGKSVPLTSGEYKLLETLVTRPNRVLSREQLLDLTCVNDMPAYDRSIDVRIGRLRKKMNCIDDHAGLIKTIRNGGYIFSAKVAAAGA